MSQIKKLNQEFYTQFCQILRHSGVTMNSTDYEKLRLSCSKWFSSIESIVEEVSSAKVELLQRAVKEAFVKTDKEFEEVKRAILRLDLNVSPEAKIKPFTEAIPWGNEIVIENKEAS